MDANLKRLLYKRKIISASILDELKSWDKSVESAISILDSNELKIAELKKIDISLSKYNKEDSYDELYDEKIRDILLLNKSLLNAIEREQHKILKNIKEMNRNKDVRNSYLSVKRESMFVDKNI